MLAGFQQFGLQPGPLLFATNPTLVWGLIASMYLGNVVGLVLVLTTVPIFLLVPQVKLPKRLDLARDADRALDSVPGLIVANWVGGRL